MRPMRSVVLLLLALMAAGCGQTALRQAKVVGLTARQTAEAAYLTVRVEYLLGHVDETTMQRARTLYARFCQVQAAYVNALRLWETGSRPADLDDLQRRVTALAVSLHALALEVSEQRPATPTPRSQPAGRYAHVRSQ